MKIPSSAVAGIIPDETPMPMPAHARAAAQGLGTTAAALATTAVLAGLGASATTAGMIFLVVVVWTATQAGMVLSLYCAFLCTLSFDYFFLPPVRTFTLAGAAEWVAIFSFVACSVAAGRVAERARRQAQQAEQRRADVERLYTLSQEMMLIDDAAGLMSRLPGMIHRIFVLEGVALQERDGGRFFASVADFPASMQASLSAVGQVQVQGQGTVEIVPGEIAALPLMLGMRQVGTLGWKPDALSREVATAIAAQAAIALARAIAIETSTRIEATREGERLRTALVDSLTHELRTPLTSIRAAATTLVQAEGLDDAARLDLAAIVDEESARLDALIGEAVEMAEIDANVVQVHPEPVRPGTLLRQALAKSQSALAKHQVMVTAEEPDTVALFDPQLLGRVLRHVLENAARYAPAGGRIVLRSRRREGRLEFEVEDDGPGIDAADQPLIFEKFYRGKNSGAKGKGTGMGLAIARAIVTAHGGGMEAMSPPGQGTTIRFWVPLREKEAGGAR
ncbi:MAG TPA: ATP-binding protein [Terracidiphilus sp.]|jgi:two-component system sensor histidine kinase KdpD|nr:ATP-binding protein [Terracidiphilus sp.]